MSHTSSPFHFSHNTNTHNYADMDVHVPSISSDHRLICASLRRKWKSAARPIARPTKHDYDALADDELRKEVARIITAKTEITDGYASFISAVDEASKLLPAKRPSPVIKKTWKADVSNALERMRAELQHHKRWRTEWNAVVAAAHESRHQQQVENMVTEFGRLIHERSHLAWSNIRAATDIPSETFEKLFAKTTV